MSRADLAYAIRQLSGGEVKATESGIRKWERGHNRPNVAAVPFIADATGVSISYLYGEGDEPEDDPALREFLHAMDAFLDSRYVRREQVVV